MSLIWTRALLFDLDGTLVDSGDAVELAWTMFADRHGLSAPDILSACHGVRSAEVLGMFAPDMDVISATAEVELIAASFGGHPTPGALDLLALTPAQSWAVVTSSTTPLATSRFAPPTGLPAPRVLVTADDVVVGKPDPTGYLLAAKLLGVSPADCVVVEDAPAGVVAGKAAGMTVIGVLTTHDAAELADADHLVADPSAIEVRHIRDEISGQPSLGLWLTS